MRSEKKQRTANLNCVQDVAEQTNISQVHIQTLVSADRILPGRSSKLRLLFINLALSTGRQVQFRGDS